MSLIEQRKFGFSFGLGMNILGAILFFRHKEYFVWFTSIGLSSLILAILYPKALTPVKKLMDKVIFVLNWLVTTISLLFVFYLIFTPIGIILRLFRKDLLNQKLDKDSKSYWLKRREDIFSSKEYYERMG